MNLNEIKIKLEKLKPILERKFKVKVISVFGSYARGTETASSDVDILVDLHDPIGWYIVEFKEFLETSLGIKVDLVTMNALRPELRDSILEEVVFV
ncbi:MAG: nucleotidyltransferase family protein [Candidatus Odinarchaeota archaeon]|nr:nucleotidyltransferase family protein [Candidatus Odinarchaeota archaeon]